MEKEFLPVGSVVLLKGGTKRVMVTGFCSVDNDDTTKIYCLLYTSDAADE